MDLETTLSVVSPVSTAPTGCESCDFSERGGGFEGGGGRAGGDCFWIPLGDADFFPEGGD